MIGTTIGHYKIEEKLGEGGMGVVYKAQDTKLNRLVALKFLPERVNSDSTAKERFLQEAQAAASLNHPNICTIHGVEDVDGSLFIAMEYIVGGTLREKLPFAKIDDAVAIASQIGEALQEAHSKAIVHRDVKADNIMLTAKGQAKVMDFGLAKLKGSLKLTRTSSTVGTLGYMAPEQIQGGEVDSRSDIFSFGVLLFEMLTGKLPFRGEHEAAMVYSIVNEEPQDIVPLVPELSPIVVNLVQRCLEKDPKDRYQHFDDIVADLHRSQKKTSRILNRSGVMPLSSSQADHDNIGTESGIRDSLRSPALSGRGLMGISAAALVVILLAVYVLVFDAGISSEPPSVLSFDRVTSFVGVESWPRYSPDGNFIAYAKYAGTRSNIVLQRAGGGNPIDLTKNSETNITPAFSPDGQYIAFRSSQNGGGIFVMGATGESIRRLTDFGFNPCWSPDGREIVFASEGVGNPDGRSGVSKLIAVDVLSGVQRSITDGDAVQPSWSPHGHRIAYWGLPRGTGQRDIWTIPAQGGEPVRVTEDAFVDWNPFWSPDGKRLYFISNRGGSYNLWSFAIDEETGQVEGQPVPITLPSPYVAYASISSDGRKISYTSVDIRLNLAKIAFDDVREQCTGEPAFITQGSNIVIWFSISKDGDHIAYSSGAPQEDIFFMRTDGTDRRQLTNDAAKDRGPEFSPDGKKLLFYSDRSGRYDSWQINLDGSSLEQLTRTTGASITRPRWFPDGKRLLVQSFPLGYVVDLTLPIEARIPKLLPPIDDKGTLFSSGPVSPDGKWIAGSRRLADSTLPQGLYVLSTQTNEYRSVTDSGTISSWLSDSRRMLYNRNGTMHMVDIVTKRTRRVSGMLSMTEVGGWSVSPDDRFVYFVRNDIESDIWVATLGN